MTSYIIRRFLLMFPTLIGIVTITFLIIQFVPGGPIDQMKSLLRGHSASMTEAGGGAQKMLSIKQSEIDDTNLEQLKKIYNLDRPLWERYIRTFLWYSPKNLEGSFADRFINRNNWEGFLVFKFGDSFYRNKSVLELIKEKLPVSASLGVTSFFITYIICIILGISKAVRHETQYDTVTSLIVLVGYSIPGFVMGIFVIVFLGPGDGAIFHLIPLSGLTSEGTPGYEEWSTLKKIEKLRQLINDMQLDIRISGDGNVSYENIPDMVAAGADILVGGSSSLFRNDISLEDSIERLRDCIKKGLDKL